MEAIRETAREVPVVHECDICVVGGSCTGVFAAVKAARLGARVALIENNAFFGGVATAGLVNVWHSIQDTECERQIIGGLTCEILDRLKKRDAASDLGRQPHRGHSGWALNTAELTIELDEVVKESGVRPFLHTRFVQPVAAEGTVTAAIVEDKSGRRAIKASQFVDATGDGDLIHRMGLPWRRSADAQPPTACAVLSGLGVVQGRNDAFSLSETVHDPKYAEALKPGLLWSEAVPGMSDLTMVAGTRAWGADCSDADQLTQAEMEGRRQVRAICDILRRHVAGGEAVHLAAVSSCIGIRETRHAECGHRLTEQEVLSGVRFPDAIANGSYPVDIHHSDEPGLTFRFLDGCEVRIAPGERPREGRWRDDGGSCATFYQIPYRSLVPRESKNVLVAGRLIDADQGAYGAIRVMVNCNQTGEAAGAAAWLALDAGVDVADVDTERLRRLLAEQDAVII